MDQVLSGPALTAGLRNDMVETYLNQYEGLKARLGAVMKLDLTSDKLTELYAYFESAPHPERWARGEDMADEAFEAVGFNVTNLDWGKRISWHRDDRMDDQTGSLFTQAQQLGENFALLDERIFYQIHNASTDSSLLETIPNAPDGAALHSATDGGGADRFGISGGNIVTGTGIATAGAIRNDFFTSMARYLQFQDTKGQPLFDESVLDRGAVITYNVANEQIFREAFIQTRTVQIVQNVAGAENVAAGTPTNVIMDAGFKVTLWPTQRITNNDWGVYLQGTRIKPIFKQNREGLQEEFATMENDSRSRATGVEYIQFHNRAGYGVALPYGTILVNNT